MRIGIIARGLTKGGVTRYINNILKEFDKNLSENFEFILFTDEKEYLDFFKNIKVVYVKNKNKLFWDYFLILKYLKVNNLDYVIYPKNIISFTHWFIKTKKINIIHDLAYFDKKLNEYKFWDTVYMKMFMKLSCLLSNKVIAVSESTKKDLINILNIDSNKISVVYEGVDDKFKKEKNEKRIFNILKKYKIKKPFLFYCGSLSPRKNILRVLIAFKKIKNKIPHNLYIASGQSWGDKEVRNYINKFLSDRVILIGYIKESDLPVIYSEADLYLYPSLYEGFGLPILEAQVCGCPVLTSNVTSCPEVAGDGALIVNPYSEEEIKNGILKILNDEEYKNKLIKNGFKNIKKFSWKKTANKILEEINI